MFRADTLFIVDIAIYYFFFIMGFLVAKNYIKHNLDIYNFIVI